MYFHKKKFGIFFMIVVLISGFSILAFPADISKYIPDTNAAEGGMTLWQSIKAGGGTMMVLAFLSIVSLSLVVYYFLMIKQEKLLPSKFLEESLDLIRKNKETMIRSMCENENNLIARVLLAGISRKDAEKVVIKEAMQDEGRRNADELWQKLSYLADVAVISPMVGLLGTVLGMMQAFNVIVFQTGAVKPVLLANGISKAMITTAAGLMIAIPTMMFHAFFRGKVQTVTAQLENITEELYYFIAEKND